MLKRISLPLLVAGVFALALGWSHTDDGAASSHREAPNMMLDPTADITDVYAFVSPDDAGMVTLMMNVIPFQEPGGGPNFYRFDPNVLYALRIDNDGDAREEIVYEFRFQDAIQNSGTFLYNTAPINALGDEAYNFRQTYTVTRVDSTTGASTSDGLNHLVPPEHVGPASTPDYAALSAMGVYDVGDGVRAFAGQRDDPFYVDLGAIFDLLTIRPGAPGNMGGGVDGLGGFNVHTIAIQVPIEELTADGGTLTGADDPDAVIGVWATTSRQSTTVLNGDGTKTHSGEWVQVSRLGLPLINEVVVPLAFKDFFNSSQPRNDVANYVEPFDGGGPILDPELPKLLAAIYGIDVPDAPRNDIVNLLTGFEGLNMPMNAGDDGVVPSDMIRLNMGVPPVPGGSEGYSRLGVIAGDIGGYPNGRRLEDDVTDISLRVMAGVLVEGFDVAPNNQLGDGVNVNDRDFMGVFPYASTSWSGYEHEHHPVVGDTEVGNETRRDVPESFGLMQNYPNPFNPETNIEYEIREPGAVRIAVYDVQGRLVQTLFDGEQASGTHRVRWDGRTSGGAAAASGVYLYRLVMNGQEQSRKMVLIK